MNITYFFRAQSSYKNSIENLFNTIIQLLPSNFTAKLLYVKYSQISLISLLKNIIFVYKHKGQLNHITGDIHYISLFLSPENTILTIHDIETLNKGSVLRRQIISLFWFFLPLKHLKYITVVSNFTKREIIKRFNISNDKIYVIPNCIPDRLKYTPKPFDAQCPTLLQIGTKHNKNLPNLIRAISNLKCKLIIIGKLNNDQIEMLINNQIDCMNYFNVNYEDVIKCYIKSDILTFVSTYEGFGLPILEANAIGRPVVTSNLASMPEVAGEAALLVNPYKPSQIQEAIIRLVNEPELRKNLIKKGIENVKRFSPESITKVYTDLYKKVYDNSVNVY